MQKRESEREIERGKMQVPVASFVACVDSFASLVDLRVSTSEKSLEKCMELVPFFCCFSLQFQYK